MSKYISLGCYSNLSSFLKFAEYLACFTVYTDKLIFVRDET